MRSKTYPIAAAAALILVGLSACTDQKPDPVDTSWADPITTPTPTPTPTVARTGPNTQISIFEARSKLVAPR